MKYQRGYYEGLNGAFAALLIFAAICGYGVIRLIEWLLSFVTFSIGVA
jgi:hypothetical protein